MKFNLLRRTSLVCLGVALATPALADTTETTVAAQGADDTVAVPAPALAVSTTLAEQTARAAVVSRLQMPQLLAAPVQRGASQALPQAAPVRLDYTPPVAGEPSLPPADYAEPGAALDPDSWKSGEFEYEWGLGAMNAQYAYARGLTGTGQNLGVIDDGTVLSHSEFAGKNNVALTMADVLPDGSTCADTGANPARILAGTCYAERGDVSATTYYFGADGNLLLGLRIGHGTHVGGTITGNRDGNGSHGVAYGANLVAARMFGDAAANQAQLGADLFGSFFCTLLVCEKATNSPSDQAFLNVYAEMKAAGVKAINNSWGYPVTYTDLAGMDALVASDPGYRQMMELVATPARLGMLTVHANGNDNGAWANPLAAVPHYIPEVEPYWVAVANLNPNGSLDASSSLCGAAARWCVTAPGTDINSAATSGMIVVPSADLTATEIRDGNGTLIGYSRSGEIPTYNGFQAMTGTSMAAPHVTGALGLLFERYPYLAPTFVRDILLTTATDLGDPGVDEVYGWGLVDLRKAIDGPGQLIKDSTVAITAEAGGIKTWSDGAWDDWKNDISGVGKLTVQGPGWLRLSGNNSFTGLTVESGRLQLAGSNTLGGEIRVTGGELLLSGSSAGTPLFIDGGLAVVTGTIQSGLTTVNLGGRLAGTGTTADLVVNGTILPGIAVSDYGRLTVGGSYVQNPGSTLAVAIAPVDHSGLVAVTGTARLNGGTVNVVANPGSYALGQRYVVLTAGGGLSGTFQNLVVSGHSLPFLKFGLGYAANSASIDVLRGATFASFAGTRNQTAVAASIDALPDSSAFLNRASQLSADQAVTFYDQSSGEIHASLQGAFQDADRTVREAALGRAIDQRHFGKQGFTLWGDLRVLGGSRKADGNAARLSQTTYAYLIGGELGLSERLRLGVLGGFGDTRLSGGRADKVSARNVHYGLYGAADLGPLALSAGAQFSDHDAKVARSVSVPGFTQTLTANYTVKVRQLYADAGFDVRLGAAVLQPFLQYANVRTGTTAIAEAGGDLALSGAVRKGDINLATGGLRFRSANLDDAHAGGRLFVSGSLGLQRAWGDLLPAATLKWNAGTPFTIHGLARDRWTMMPQLSLGYAVTDKLALQAGYSGQYSGANDSHIGNVRLSYSF